MNSVSLPSGGNCQHEYEDRGSPYGSCVHCGEFSLSAFPDRLHSCCICGRQTDQYQDAKGLWYCFYHAGQTPEENLHPEQIALKKISGQIFEQLSEDDEPVED